MSNLDPEAQRRILHRLRRAQGQLAAVIRAVEEGKPCRDVVTQRSATSRALNRSGIVMVSSALQECLNQPESAERELEQADIEKLFMMLG